VANERVRVAVDARGVARVALTRADKHNGVDFEMVHALRRAVRALRRDRRVRVVILHGDGPSFCAGLDFKSVMAQPRQAFLGYLQLFKPWRNDFQRVNLDWRDLPVPVIAAIHGSCFGAGMQLALAADVRIARPDARLSIMEAKWGLVPDMGATVLWRNVLRRDVAAELAMTGRVVGGQEAVELGLVTRLADDPLAEAETLAAELLTRSPDSVSATKRLLDQSWFATEYGALAAERRWQRRLMGGKNQRIAVQNNMKKAETPFEPRRIGG
jgi:enoyl-CoA hydratase/carnithine racemase